MIARMLDFGSEFPLIVFGTLCRDGTETPNNMRSALEAAGGEFIPEKNGGAGVRLRKP